MFFKVQLKVIFYIINVMLEAMNIRERRFLARFVCSG